MDAIWVDALLVLGAVCVLLAFIAGLWLVASPGTALSIAAKLNREYSVAWLQRILDAPRSTEPFIYRHHKVVGGLLIVATAYFFWHLLTGFDQHALVALFAGPVPVPILEILVAVFIAVLVIGNGVGAVLGFVIMVRPSILKDPERWANRWVAADRAVETLDRRLGSPESLAHRHPRRIGLGILFAALYIGLIGAAVLY